MTRFAKEARVLRPSARCMVRKHIDGIVALTTRQSDGCSEAIDELFPAAVIAAICTRRRKTSLFQWSSKIEGKGLVDFSRRLLPSTQSSPGFLCRLQIANSHLANPA
jgi:hypothetical protein